MLFKTLSLAAVAVLSLAAPAMAEDVTITLTGVEARGGVLLTAVQTRSEFMRDVGAHSDRTPNPQAGTLRLTFRNVAPGDYAVSVLHDADSDGQMKLEGYMPAEGWAMINGESLRAEPTFDQVKFTVPASGDVELTLPMIYPR